MRIFVPVVTVLALSLACGGGGMAPESPPVDVPDVFAAPVPVAAPEPVPAPPTGPITAAVGPFSGGDVAIVCTQGGKVVTCPEGPCLGEYERCEPGPEVDVVGMASLGEGPLALPLAKATLTTYADPACNWPQAEIMEGDATTKARPVAAFALDDAALAPIKGIASESEVTAAWQLDLDGKEGDEIVAEVSTETGNLLIVLYAGSPIIIFDNRHAPLPDDASEEARMEAEINSSGTLVLLGVTDAENDGSLEFVLEGSGYEASWIVVMKLDGSPLGSVGCAV